MSLLSLEKNKNMRGFTLIELAIVMIISGFLLVSAMQAYALYEKESKTRLTNDNMAEIDKAINDYYALHGRFPCPSDPGKISGEWYGKEWGRVRENGAGYIPNQKQIWQNGEKGPISDSYCKDIGIGAGKDTDTNGDDIGDGYAACLAAGQASVCKIAATSGTNNTQYGWPSPNFNQNDGAQRCGNAGAAFDRPTRSACTATGEKADDTADYDGSGVIDPAEKDADLMPQDISCVDNGCLGIGEHDKAAGGDGDNSTSTGDGLPNGEAVKDLFVLIGGIPFYDLGISARDAVDGYGNPVRYAVTLGLTRKQGWDPKRTGIVIATQQPGSSVANMGQENAQYALVSFGKNASDDYFYSSMPLQTTITSPPIKTTSPRTIISCKETTATGGIYANNSTGGDGYIENENCDADADFIASLGKTMNWNGIGAPDKSYNDDTVVSNVSSAINNLWVASGNDIYSTNGGNIGINTTDVPVFKLQVNGKTHAKGDLLIDNNSVACANSTTDADGDGSRECNNNFGFSPENLEDGTTCPVGEVLSAINNGGRSYTCKKLDPVTIKCPDNTYSLVEFNSSKVKCMKRITGASNKCTICNLNGTSCNPASPTTPTCNTPLPQ